MIEVLLVILTVYVVMTVFVLIVSVVDWLMWHDSKHNQDRAMDAARTALYCWAWPGFIARAVWRARKMPGELWRDAHRDVE